MPIDGGLIMIYKLILTLIMSLHPRVGLERAHAVAVAIDDVARSESEAVTLLAIAYHESALRVSVEDCSACTGPRCDHGRAVGLWQIHRHWWGGHDRDALCSDPGLAAQLAAEAWRRTGSLERFAGCQVDLGCKAADEIRAIRDAYSRRLGR